MHKLSPVWIHKTHRNWFLILFLILLVSRFVMLVASPHMDPSEARYAEISRKMVETGNWVTPQFSYGVPFLAKPPLSMWMSALGIELFGVNEFGSRIFIFLAALAVLGLVMNQAKREFSSKKMGLVAATFLFGFPLFFYCSAAVMTDLPLLLGVVLAMIGFRNAFKDICSPAYVFHLGIAFFGLAIGLLAKGPLVLVLVCPPVFVHFLVTGKYKQSGKRLLWIAGTLFAGMLLMLLISVPWYVLAERRTPGFLNYFLIGEHFKRFTVSEWAGDLYGSAHSRVPGTIWLLACCATFPWFFVLFAAPWKRWRSFVSWAMEHDGKGLYWVLWLLWPLVFFTPARNIITTYPLPMLPALAFILADLYDRFCKQGIPLWVSRMISVQGIFCALAAIFVSFGPLVFPCLLPKMTEKILVKSFEENSHPVDNLLYYRIRKFSAEFYTDGKVESTYSEKKLRSNLKAPGCLFVAMREHEWEKLPADIKKCLSLVKRFPHQSNLYVECAGASHASNSQGGQTK